MYISTDRQTKGNEQYKQRMFMVVRSFQNVLFFKVDYWVLKISFELMMNQQMQPMMKKLNEDFLK